MTPSVPWPGNDRLFDELCNKVKFCTKCPRMEESARILSRSAGSTNAPLMFVGEAPGRLGADSCGIPFHGDRAGHNFEDLLAFAGMDRSRVFVTNAVLCNPRADGGNNATPNRVEVQNCSGYLKEQIDLVCPRIVVALGATALEALKLIHPHEFQLGIHVRTLNEWYGRKLIPLYHPGARAMVHRSMSNQRSDYQFVAEQLRRLGYVSRPPSGQTRKEVAELAAEIIRRRQTVSYFALHKLMYLVECESWTKLGRPFTGAFFLRQKDGPYCTDLHLAKLRKSLAGLVVRGDPTRPVLQLRQLGNFDRSSICRLSAEESEVLLNVLSTTADLSDAELKTKVYLSSPMRRILRLERGKLINLYNSPIQFAGVSTISA